MNNFKKIASISVLSFLGIAGASIIVASKKASRVFSIDKYNIVNLIAENMTNNEDQEVSFTYNGSSFTYRLHNVTKDTSNNLILNDGYILNVTALNGLSYVEATAINGNGIMTFGIDEDGTVNANDRLEGFGKFNNTGSATNFAIISNGEATISSIEVSYSCTNGDESLVDTSESTFSDDFVTFKEFIYIRSASDYEDFASRFYESGLSYEDYVIYLEDDITLTDFVTPAGSMFGGYFDGNGYTITTDNTLLPILSTGSNVHDLNIQINMTCSDSYNGALAQNIEDDAVINNVHSSGTIESAMDYTGGIVGIINNGNPTIKNCSSSISISAIDRSSNIGGIIGGTDATEGGKIINSKFLGSLSGYNLTNVGGIVGKTCADITNCDNEGAIEITTTAESKYTGGIVGFANGNITNCKNKASIKGYNYVGGIAGQSNMIIDNCENSESIISSDYAGGISARNNGEILNSTFKNGTITNSYNYAGGISGTSYGNITNCTFDGTVRNGYKYAGGITGMTHHTNVTNCVVTSTAKIQCYLSNSSYIGGLIGSIQGGFVTGCSTEGVITQVSGNYSGISYIGGFAGQVTTFRNDSGTVYMPTLKENVKPSNSVFTQVSIENGTEANKYCGYVFGQLVSTDYTIYWVK